MRYFLMAMAVLLSAVGLILCFIALAVFIGQRFPQAMGYVALVVAGSAAVAVLSTFFYLSYLLGKSFQEDFEEGVEWKLFGWTISVRDDR